MKLIFSTSLIVCILGFLSGCAIDSKNSGWRGIGKTYQSEVKPLPDGNFFVETEAALLAGRQTGAAEVAKELANNHCSLRKQKMVVLKQDLTSNFLLNGVSRLTFRCD